MLTTHLHLVTKIKKVYTRDVYKLKKQGLLVDLVPRLVCIYIYIYIYIYMYIYICVYIYIYIYIVVLSRAQETQNILSLKKDSMYENLLKLGVTSVETCTCTCTCNQTNNTV